MTTRTPADLAAIEAKVDAHGVMPTVLALMDRAETAEAEVERLGTLGAKAQNARGDAETRAAEATAERDALRARLAKVEALAERQHQRQEPEMFGLITWPTCSCGRTETRVMPDNALSVVPAQYPCFNLLELRATLSDEGAGA